MAQSISSITIWINAFIPKEVEGYTKTIPNHKDMTMIPGPNIFSDCYHTDQRAFSSDIKASSRMHCQVKFEFKRDGDLYKITRWKSQYWCDKTVECDCEDGENECEKFGATDRMKFSLLYPDDDSSGIKYLKVQINAAANNPCSPSSRLFGDIDFKGKFHIDLMTPYISFKGKIDEFPAFEAYAQKDWNAPKKIFNVSPPKGNTVTDLPGGANQSVEGVAWL